MITLGHNIEPAQFKWLWAKYVKAGNIEKHCTACMIGPYSKKFSAATNPKMLEQRILVMDEVPEGQYEAIYFCGVLKKGYLNNNPEKNNYRHNVHFAVRPVNGAHDVWDFENWHVEIDGGVLEHIPESFELKEKFFHEPYTSHYYTCRIFRWMVGHFYPQELDNVLHGYPAYMKNEDGEEVDMGKTIIKYIQLAKAYVNDFMMEGDCMLPVIDDGYFEHCWQLIKHDVESTHGIKLIGCDTAQKIKEKVMKDNLIDRKQLTFEINDALEGHSGARYICPKGYEDARLLGEDMKNFFALGIEEALDMLFPYQERRTITFD